MSQRDTFFAADCACAALREAGINLAPAQVRIEAPDDRWLVRLPGGRLAWFPANAKGRELLERERRVLRLLAERCSFHVPRILFESPQGRDVRAAVPGVCDPWGLYRRASDDVAHARRGPRVGPRRPGAAVARTASRLFRSTRFSLFQSTSAMLCSLFVLG
jgi:hypothetical protein